MRVRITFSKFGALRYIGHLDLHRIWERTCRRAGIALSYSQGFHPQPRISLAAALPLGFIGQAELMDLWLEKDEDLIEIIRLLQESAPAGLKLTAIQSIENHQAALQTQVKFADYEIIFLDPVDGEEIAIKIERLISSTTIRRTRRSRQYDLRPLIVSLKFIISDDDNPARLIMRLSASPAATGRPEEILSEFEIEPENTRIIRTGLVLKAE
jgi:radical SAM-linked protein